VPIASGIDNWPGRAKIRVGLMELWGLRVDSAQNTSPAGYCEM
jgi:hypothetical protein